MLLFLSAVLTRVYSATTSKTIEHVPSTGMVPVKGICQTVEPQRRRGTRCSSTMGDALSLLNPLPVRAASRRAKLQPKQTRGQLA
ncbi:MAG: hypothetical protein CMD83_12025 [Gammaproteobacteria bacterium]|nr:hypothetical protein [Gammaproteobacteria bacterium]